MGWRSTGLAALVAALALAACSSKRQCPQGQTDCGGECVDLQTDTRRCGACVSPTSVCPTGATCEVGQCRCPADRQDVCRGACVNLQTDLGNCGACGHECGLGTCAGGACTCDTSPSTVMQCSGASPECVDIANDPRNCSGCGNACHLTDEQCVNSACACAAPKPDACPASSPTACVNLQTYVKNCGQCGVECVENETCAGGNCACAAPFTRCGSGETRVCTNVKTDPVHCGACENAACPTGATCENGQCQCPADKSDVCAGACVDEQTDPSNCGGCRNICATGQTCAGGHCATLVCAGSACLGGTACCSNGACPLRHPNGPSPSYFHCNALATPGDPATYTADMALQAAKAWQPGGVDLGASNCSCQAWRSTDGTQCGQWCFGAYLPGRGAIGDSLSCGSCITSGTFEWR